MAENNETGKFPDFITYAREFEGYGWYKPIIILVIMVILLFIANTVLFLVDSTRLKIVYLFTDPFRVGGDGKSVEIIKNKINYELKTI